MNYFNEIEKVVNSTNWFNKSNELSIKDRYFYLIYLIMTNNKPTAANGSYNPKDVEKELETLFKAKKQIVVKEIFILLESLLEANEAKMLCGLLNYPHCIARYIKYFMESKSDYAAKKVKAFFLLKETEFEENRFNFVAKGDAYNLVMHYSDPLPNFMGSEDCYIIYRHRGAKEPSLIYGSSLDEIKNKIEKASNKKVLSEPLRY